MFRYQKNKTVNQNNKHYTTIVVGIVSHLKSAQKKAIQFYPYSTWWFISLSKTEYLGYVDEPHLNLVTGDITN